MQTNNDNIYAAGDVAETYDITTKEYTVNALWTCAVQQGMVAGRNIADQKSEYNGSFGLNSLNFFSIPLISFGITRPKDEAKYIILTRHNPRKDTYKKIVIENSKIKGVILLGEIKNAGIILSLLQKQTDISSYQEELLSDQFNYGSLLKYEEKVKMNEYYNI